jgi:hypothetical protein
VQGQGWLGVPVALRRAGLCCAAHRAPLRGSRPLRASIPDASAPPAAAGDAARSRLPRPAAFRPAGRHGPGGQSPLRRSPRGVFSRASGTHSHRCTFAVLLREQVANTRPPSKKGRCAEILTRSVLTLRAALRVRPPVSPCPSARRRLPGTRTTNSRQRWQHERHQPLREKQLRRDSES